MRAALALPIALGLASMAAAQESPVPIPSGVTHPITWAESHGRGCHRYHGRRTCEGPRRVPVADAEAIARAEALGITSASARRALLERPREAWVAAIGSAPSADLAWPVDGGRVWRGFGIHAGIAVGRGGRLRRTRRRHAHEGVDIGAAAGTPILAVNDGLVVYSDNGMSGYGNAVLVVHADASVTLYGHCSATFVVAGQRVARGEVIAAVGDTGLAHGAHLHFELHVDGHAVDPLPRFAAPPGPPAAVETDGEGAPAPEAQAALAPAPPPPSPPSDPEELDGP